MKANQDELISVSGQKSIGGDQSTVRKRKTDSKNQGLKIIFLDIDGVLVTGRTVGKSEMEQKADRRCMRALNKLIRQSGAKIVVSSSWRAYGLNQIQGILTLWGVRGEVVGITPDHSELYRGLWLNRSRTDEIQMWFHNYPQEVAADQRIAGFVIIDDGPIDPPLDAHLVRTEFRDGFTELCIISALAILNNKPPVWV